MDAAAEERFKKKRRRSGDRRRWRLGELTSLRRDVGYRQTWEKQIPHFADRSASDGFGLDNRWKAVRGLPDIGADGAAA
jgi:hypothetical protein